MLGLQSRDKWSLTNYDAIEIKSKGFYASSGNNTIRSEFNINIETEKWTIFLINLSRLLSHEKSFCFVRRLSTTNMVVMQTQKRVTTCTYM